MSNSFLYDPLGPRGRRRARLASLVVIAVSAIVVAFLLQRLGSRGQLESERRAILLDPATGVPQTLGLAALATLKAAGIAMAGALIVGLFLALGRLSQHRGTRWLCGITVEGFRGVPLLLLMLFGELGLPRIGIELSLLTIVVLALVAYNSAVLCEIIRGGVLALDAGQTEASQAMGVSPGMTLRKVLLPQAIPQMLPVIISQVVILLKDTSLGYIIGYSELLRSGRSVVEFYGNLYALQIYVAVAVIYIGVNVAISTLARATGRRTRRMSSSATKAGPSLAAAPAAP